MIVSNDGILDGLLFNKIPIVVMVHSIFSTDKWNNDRRILHARPHNTEQCSLAQP